MKNLKKTIALLLAATFVLTGCTMDGQKFITALDKLSEAKYYEQQTHITYELSYSGGDEYFRDEMRSLKPLIDAFAIDYKAVYEGSVNSGKLKSHVSAEANLEPVTLSGEMWLDIDKESDNPKEEIIVKIPALAKALMTEIRANGDMLDMFIETLAPSIPGFWNYVIEVEYETGETKLVLEESFVEAILALEEYFKDNTILGSGGLLYEIAIDENGYIANETINANIRFSEELYDYAPYYLSRFIPFYLDEDSGTVELIINVKTDNSEFNASKAVQFPSLTKENTYDILSEWIEEAERDTANSAYHFPYVSYIFEGLSDVGRAPVDFPIIGTYDGVEIDSVVSLIDVGEYGGDFRMPLRQAAELFGGEVGWNEENKFAFWIFDDNELVIPSVLYAETGELYQDENSVNIERNLYIAYESAILNGTAFVGISDIEYFIDIDFGFDDSANTLLVR